MASESSKEVVNSDEVINNDDNDSKPTEPSPSLSKSGGASAEPLLPEGVLSKDIVFGRGKGYHGHHGNERMREIIDKYKMQYHAIDRSQKRDLVEVVYDEIVQDGARFLFKESTSERYVEADRTMAIQKVSNALRCKKSLQREAAAAARSSPGKKRNPKPQAENDTVTGALASRPLQESLSSPTSATDGGLTSLGSLAFINNNTSGTLYSSQLNPWNLANQSLLGDTMLTPAAMGTDALSLAAAFRDPSSRLMDLALGIINPQSSALPYAAIPMQQNLDHVALLRQELLLQQQLSALSSAGLGAGSMVNDLTNRLILEQLLSPSRTMQGNSMEGKSMDNKKSQGKDSGM